MILLLDNYDSFTYNLYQYLAELGAEVTVQRNDALTPDAVEKLAPQALVLSPGPGRPENAGYMNEIIRRFAGKIPMLGVCLGHQALAQVHGAVIGYAPSLMHGKVSEITHDGSTLFTGLPSPLTATRYHSLTVEPKTLPHSFKVTARTADGVIMGLEHARLSLYGVQFHPESIMTPDGKGILQNFLNTLP